MSQENPTQVYQFKITLKQAKPSIWRRILVPATYTFWGLHVAIQDAMGWDDYHLHQFEIKDPKYDRTFIFGIPDDDDFDWGPPTLPEWEHNIADHFTLENHSAEYMYDFGDGWEHTVRLEAIKDAEPGLDYPQCIKGRRACPPEDVGGVWGYMSFLEILNDPTHDDHEMMVEWIGGEFDPVAFDPGEVEFSDPALRWQLAFGDNEGF